MSDPFVDFHAHFVTDDYVAAARQPGRPVTTFPTICPGGRRGPRRSISP